jgi:hypothetical protein
MASIYVFFLDLLAVFFQFFAAYFGYRIYRMRKLSSGWLALVFGFILQGIRRFITFLTDANLLVLPDENFIIYERVFAVVISLFILVGIFSMLKDLKNRAAGK